MNLNSNPDTRPNIDLDAHANLDIKLDSWQGTTAVGLICVAVVTIFGLYFKFKA